MYLTYPDFCLYLCEEFGATHCVFNPIDKLVEMIEENKKLYAAILKEKDETIALLEKFIAVEKKKK